MTAYQDYHTGHLIYKQWVGTGVLKISLKIGLPTIVLYWSIKKFISGFLLTFIFCVTRAAYP